MHTEDFISGVNAAIIKFDKYFSESWREFLIATAKAMDPRAKFHFWKGASFQQQDTDAAEAIVFRTWQDCQPSVTPLPPTAEQVLFRQYIRSRQTVELHQGMYCTCDSYF